MCYGCGDTDHMYHVCPKRRLAKTIEPAPVDHTWANIVSGTTTSVDVPGISDSASMDTDTGPQMVGDKIPSATDDGKKEPVPISIEGRQLTSDASTSHMTVTSKQVSSTHTPLKWANEDPDIEQTPTAETRPSGNASAAAKEWPPLHQPTADHQDLHTSQIHHTPPCS